MSLGTHGGRKIATSCQLPSIRYYYRTPKNFTSSYQEKKRTKETIAAITEATSYQSIAKECKIGQNIPGTTWRTLEINHVEGGQLPDSTGSPALKWQGIVNVKTKQNTVIETQNMKIAISSETI